MKKFFLLIPTTAPNGTSGPEAGNNYEMCDACPICGAGATPIGDAKLLDFRKTKKRLFRTYDWKILIDNPLAGMLDKLHIPVLHKTYNSQGKELPYYELRGEAILPRFSSNSSGYKIDGQCKSCRRSGYFNDKSQPLKLVYNNLNDDLLCKNVLETFECFGISKLRKPFVDSNFATPKLVISELIVGTFLAEKVKGVEFVPVTIHQ